METKKNDILQDLKDYFKNTPREQVEKDWAETEKYDKVGRTVFEFMGLMNQNRVIGSHGYFQKGNRYFFKEGDIVHKSGFKSKQDCEEWINLNREKYGLDWRAGFMIKFKTLPLPLILVDKNGKEVKCF